MYDHQPANSASADDARQHIHELFEAADFVQLYREQPEILQDMLMIESEDELEDLLDADCPIEEDLFWLFEAVHRGESLLIEPYAGDVSDPVAGFLQGKLPEPLFARLREHVSGMYVDLGTKDNLKERVAACCKELIESGWSLRLDFDDTFNDGIYFLSVTQC